MRDLLLIKNGTIHLDGGQVLKGDLLTKGKLIEAVGQGISADGARVIDAEGLDVYPGFILPLCNIGVRGDNVLRDKDHTEDSSPINPQIEVKYSFNLRDLKMQHFGRLGITAYGLTPGITPLIAGQMSLINSDGDSWDDIKIVENVAMKGNYTRTVMNFYAAKHKMPTTHMGMFHMLDKAFADAREHMEKADAPYDQKNLALAKVLSGEMPFFVNTHSTIDIENVYHLAQKHSFKPVFCGAFGVDKCADKIIEAGYDVVVGEFTYLFNYINHETDLEKLIGLYRKGLKLSLGSSGDEGYPPAYDQLLWTATLLRRAGATPEELIDMMTINPARAFGADGIIGSIKAGKQADLIISRGNPADKYTNYIDYTVVAGNLFYEREGKAV